MHLSLNIKLKANSEHPFSLKDVEYTFIVIDIVLLMAFDVTCLSVRCLLFQFSKRFFFFLDEKKRSKKR